MNVLGILKKIQKLTYQIRDIFRNYLYLYRMKNIFRYLALLYIQTVVKMFCYITVKHYFEC